MEKKQVVKKLKEVVKRYDGVKKTVESSELICPVQRINESAKTEFVSPTVRLNQSKQEKGNYFDGVQFTYLHLKNYINTQVKLLINMKTVKIPRSERYIKNFMFNEIFKWIPNSYVFVSSGTGTGKTHFIESLILESNAKVLVLTNRNANKMQIQKHLGIDDKQENYRFRVTSYQEIERNESIGTNVLNYYDYIVLDESHYFLEDSLFNNHTNASYLKILSTTRPVKIFMSATNENIREKIVYDLLWRTHGESSYLFHRLFNYENQYNSSVISKIERFEELDELVEKIKKTNDKWLIFVKSMKQGNDLMNLLNPKDERNIDVEFISREIVESKKYKSDTIYKKIIEQERFDFRVLVCTSLYDNGVNFLDEELKHVAIFDNSYVEMIQMIGRKRCINEQDSFTLYLIDESKNSLKGSKQKLDNYLYKKSEVKVSLKRTKEINQEALILGESGDAYRRWVYKNPFSRNISFNDLGEKQLEIEMNTIADYIACDNSFERKAKLVNEKLNQKATIKDERNLKYVIDIMEFINVPISSKDKDTKIKINNAYINIFGRECSTDKLGRSISLPRLQLRHESKGIPLKIEEHDKTFFLRLEEKDVEKLY